VRLAVMNLLAAELPGGRWLDLCCGSGVMACEALQRGAAAVVAVERDRRIAAVARANLEAVLAGRVGPTGGHRHGQMAGEPPEARVVCDDVLHFLAAAPQGQGSRPFDLIYADPPYTAGLHAPIAAAVRQGNWLAAGGTLVWECAAEAVPAEPAGWRRLDSRRYGGTSLVMLTC
jgi:16S rRNA (guanine(966)-N(2))-methyltransferase RsmD